MPTARKHTVIPGQPGFFHCFNRCVRRAWLCGNDPVTGKNFDHRRDWMIKRMHQLTECFAIDIYAYALMNNHYHIVIYVDPERVNSWSDEQVIRKWKTLWNWRRPDSELDIPSYVPPDQIQVWRERLGDVSWAMRLLNEPIARIANAEDDATGHFWESRFKCTPLLDEPGLVMCLVYADLNPIKAGVAVTPEQSDYTSIQQRIRELALEANNTTSKSDRVASTAEKKVKPKSRVCLQPVSTSEVQRTPLLGITLDSYLDLVEKTAEAIRKSQAIESNDALVSLGIKPSGWMHAVTDFMRLFRTAAGTEESFTDFMQRSGIARRQDAAARRLLLVQAV